MSTGSVDQNTLSQNQCTDTVSKTIIQIFTQENMSLFGLSKQPFLLSNHHISTASAIDFNMQTDLQQQFKEINVVVSLFDCMKCYIRIPRCEIPVSTT